jgi:hypothetical protein
MATIPKNTAPISVPGLNRLSRINSKFAIVSGHCNGSEENGKEIATTGF